MSSTSSSRADSVLTVALSEAFGKHVSSTPSLNHLLEIAKSHPDNVALISPHQSSCLFPWIGKQTAEKPYVEWTFADLDHASSVLAKGLSQHDAIKGRPIATFVYNQAEWALFFWAAIKLSVPFVPINSKCALKSDEVTHMLRTTQPGVLVMADSSIAHQLEQNAGTELLSEIPLRVMLSREDECLKLESKLLSDLVTGNSRRFSHFEVANCNAWEDPGLILFTSGTTSLPKPAPLSGTNLCQAGLASKEARHVDQSHRLCQNLPQFHGYGIGWTVAFWLAGASIVYPAESFDALASLESIEQFRCTHTCYVPTTVNATLAHPAVDTKDLSSLESVDISGAVVLPSFHERFTQKFKNVQTNTSYGMTEAGSMILWDPVDGSPLRDGIVLLGRPCRGSTVRICEPGTRVPLPRGKAGEMHCSGPSVVTGYLTSQSLDTFYKDEEGNQWIITGDQAMMTDDGFIHVTGRYKDLIIRGGENISPANLEACLNKSDGVNAQVVGTPDLMAGEVPIAVVQTNRHRGFSLAQDLQQRATRELGPAFSPKRVLILNQDLHLDAFPTTTSGKVQKVKLAKIVRDYLDQLGSTVIDEEAPTVEAVISIWADLSGQPAAAIKSSTLIQSFADSLMMMQFSGIVKDRLGKDITVEDYKVCERVQDHADLIDSRPDHKAASHSLPQRIGPPSINDLPHARDSEALYQQTKTDVSKSLAGLGLCWDDVEDAYPLPGTEELLAHRSRPQSWNLRWAYHIEADSVRLLQALKQTLANHATLRSICVHSGTVPPLLVTVRPSEQWFANSITTGYEIDKAEDLKTLLLDDPQLDYASYPGPMLRANIATIRSDGSSGLVMQASHAVNDASATKLFLDDLAAALGGASALPPHASFKDYAAAHFTHREGPGAKAEVEYHARRLRGIGAQKGSYWPPQRAPEFFKGNDFGWTHWDGRESHPRDRGVSLAEKKIGQVGLRRMAQVKDSARLKAEHNVAVVMLVKTALAILNIMKNGHQEAVFGTCNAARSWPFSSSYSAEERQKYGGNPLDISGCTIEYILDRTRVSSAQSVLSLLQQVTTEEMQNSAYAHAPLQQICQRLKEPASAYDWRSAEERLSDAEAVVPLIRRQSLNWLPINPMSQQNREGLKWLEMLTRMDNGLTVTGFVLDDRRTVALSFTWDAEHLTEAEATEALDDLVMIVERIGCAENWDKTIFEVITK